MSFDLWQRQFQGDPLIIGRTLTLRKRLQDGGQILAEFAGNGNSEGVRRLLDLGVAVTAVFEAGDGSWDVAPNSTALHVAMWRAQHAIVGLLLERGAPVDAQDGKGRAPLALAVRACVESHWTDRRSPDSVRALLAAGAALDDIKFRSGYEAVDELLKAQGAREGADPWR